MVLATIRAVPHFWTIVPMMVLVQSAFICIAVYRWINWRRNRKCDLVHLTRNELANKIRTQRRLRTRSTRAIFALRKSVFDRCETSFEKMLATFLFPPCRVEAHVPIHLDIRHHFELFRPAGVYTGLRCIFGNYYATYKMLTFNPPRTRRLTSTAFSITVKLYTLDISIAVLFFLVIFMKSWFFFGLPGLTPL